MHCCHAIYFSQLRTVDLTTAVATVIKHSDEFEILRSKGNKDVTMWGWKHQHEQLLVMPTDLLTDWKWLPGELLSRLECWKTWLAFLLDMKYWTKWKDNAGLHWGYPTPHVTATTLPAACAGHSALQGHLLVTENWITDNSIASSLIVHTALSTALLASYPGLLTPAFAACSTDTGRPGKTDHMQWYTWTLDGHVEEWLIPRNHK